jgi:hypothetical protein
MPYDFDPAFPKRSISGFYYWYVWLGKALERAGCDVRHNDYVYARKHPRHPVGLVGHPILLEEWDLPNPALLGPCLYDHPRNNPDLTKDSRFRYYLVTCDWLRDIFVPYYGDSCLLWFAGVDTGLWPDTAGATKDTDILVYDKIRWNREGMVPNLIEHVINSVSARGLSYRVIKYGNLSHEEYRALLKRSRAMIFLCEHETQGIAYQEALASNVPVLAWDPGLWLDPQWPRYEIAPPRATSVPYFSRGCGERFRHAGEFNHTFSLFWSKLSSYRPRAFVETHLSLKKSAELYLQYYRRLFEPYSSA